MSKYLDTFLNFKTMYWLTKTGLYLISFTAIILSLFGLLPFSPFWMVINLGLLLLSSQLVSYALSKLFRITPNQESSTITSLILFLILSPTQTINYLWFPILASLLAISSKYLFGLQQKHVFNPIVITLIVLNLLGRSEVSWWVANPLLLPLALTIGFLILKKIRRFTMFFTFAAASLITITVYSLFQGYPLLSTLIQVFTSWPLIFFGTIMLTEPSTTPPTNNLQIVYASLVGLLFGSQLSFGPFYSTPEMALFVGNLFSSLVSFKSIIKLTFQRADKLSPDISEYIFLPDKHFNFLAGQYLEITLATDHPDDRGNRRYFTIASSPTEKTLRFGVRFVKGHSSSFKTKLSTLKTGDTITASHLAGNFTLPKDPQQKLVFIAGGIGITPFISMIRFLLDTKQKRDIILLYFNKEKNDIVYQNIFISAKKIGVQTFHILTNLHNLPQNWTGPTGYLTPTLLSQLVPDYTSRLFYLSGPDAMVYSYKQVLSSVKISSSQIKTDYFPGY